MKKFTVLVVNRKKNKAAVVGTIEAKSEIEARKAAFPYFKYVDITVGEQLVVASKNRYNQFYKQMVEEA